MMVRLLGRIRIRAHPGGHGVGPPRRSATYLSILFVVALTGCHTVSVHEARLQNAIAERIERLEATRDLSGVTGVLLSRHDLLVQAPNDPGGTARTLEARLGEHPEPDGPLALAELSYQAGLECEGTSLAAAMPWYRDAAVFASFALSEPDGSRPDLAIRIHNHALAQLIRISREQGFRTGRDWHELLREQGLTVSGTAPFLNADRLTSLRVADDLFVEGMDHVYYSRGLGVSLVAHRKVDPAQSPDVRDRFLPVELRTAATAVVVPQGGMRGGEWRRNPASVVLYDPFAERSLVLGGRVVALAGDRTTPLAMQVSRGHPAALEWAGLLDSDFDRPGVDAGLYMLRPYEPGKIPVVLVHGLVSSPRAYVQTINELRNSPALAARYQFWVFLYPTGLPIPLSGAKLRESLVHARETLDPAHADPSLDQMVLIGHSMGGLLSKMMVQDTGKTLWKSAITVPENDLDAPPELRQEIDNTLVFRPLPFVRRAVFIATPHRGSPIANDWIGRTVSSFIHRPSDLSSRIQKLVELNGPDVITRELRTQPLNAIGNLRTDSPILAALDRIPIDPSVPYHSIIPLIGGVTNTDGVVPYSSSHLKGAASELVLPGTHVSQEKPEVTAELRRILFLHLASLGEPVMNDVDEAVGPAVLEERVVRSRP